MIDTKELARNAPGFGIKDDAPMPDMAAMRQYRLGRLQAELVAAECDAAVLNNSINIRYAIGTRSAQISSMHMTVRTAVVPPEGGATVFSWFGDDWMPETIAEIRPMPVYGYFPAGERSAERVKEWARGVRDVVRTGNRIAVDIAYPEALHALEAEGFNVIPAEPLVEHACAIKCEEEIACLVNACTVADTAMWRIRKALEPGVTENDLYAILNQTNFERGGEWIEYRLMASGGHINPWDPEAGEKVVRAGELVAFDCGLVGPMGYSADVSRTFFCEPGVPTEHQRVLYQLAYENVHRNLELIKAGVGFRELSEKSWMPPEEYLARRYPVMVHGIGMGDEWPAVPWPIDWERDGYDGVLEENMAICVESYIGSERGGEGVKLEEQVLVTRDGYQQMSTFPYERLLLS